MANSPPATTSSAGSVGSTAWPGPSASASPHTSLRLLGHVEDRQPPVGDLGGHRDVLVADRRDVDRDARAHRMVDQLERLAEAGPLSFGQRQVVDAGVLDRLAPPHHPADLDDLAGAGERAVVGDAVEAFDHLRARRAEAEDGAAVGDGVEAGRGLAEARRRAAVDVEDARADFDLARSSPRGSP